MSFQIYKAKSEVPSLHEEIGVYASHQDEDTEAAPPTESTKLPPPQHGVGELHYSWTPFETLSDIRSSPADASPYESTEATPAEPDRPPYYTRFPIDPATFGMLNSLPAWAFNVVKYVCRAPYKENEEADIRKAIRYCEMRLEELKRRREGTIGNFWNRPL